MVSLSIPFKVFVPIMSKRCHLLFPPRTDWTYLEAMGNFPLLEGVQAFLGELYGWFAGDITG